jgi:hypothetical protein
MSSVRRPFGLPQPDRPGSTGARVPCLLGMLVLGGVAASAGFAADFEFGTVTSLQAVVARGDPSPLGGAFGFVHDPVLLRSKAVAFLGTDSEIFVHGPGGLVAVAKTGDPSPLGGTLRDFGLPSMTSDPDLVVFRARVQGGASFDGIFRWDGSSISAILGGGDAAPGGGTFLRFEDNPATNGAGDVAFFAADSTVSRDGVFIVNGAAAKIAAEREPSPCGGEYRGIHGGGTTGPSLNDSGSVVFAAQGSGSTNKAGVFLWDGVTVSPVACEGDAAPTAGAFRDFGRHPSIDANGDVIFQAETDVLSGEGLFRAAGGMISAIAFEGDPAPGGGTFSGFRSSLIPGLDGGGDVAFVAETSASGTTVYLLDGAVLAPVVSELDACPLGGIFERIDDVVALDPGGEVTFEASCTGGRGVFRSPTGGPVTILATQATPTAVGTGLRFRNPSGRSADTVALRASRTAVMRASCRGTGCTVEKAVAPNDVVANPAGHLIQSMNNTLTGSGSRVVFDGTMVGTVRASGIFLDRGGTIDAVVLEGDPIPGGGGTFLVAPTTGFSSGSVALAENRGTVAFLADVDHPDFDSGMFAWRGGATTALAQASGPAPGGGMFLNFDTPSVKGRTVAFAAEIDDGRRCVYRYRTTGAGRRLLCTGDAAPPAVGGTINEIHSVATTGRRTSFIGRLLGAGIEECLFTHRGSSTEALACEGDPGPNADLIEGFGDPFLNPLSPSGPRVAAPLSATDSAAIAVFRPGLVTPVAVSGDSVPAPIGGTFSGFEGPPSLRGRRVAFEAFISDGAAGSAIFLAQTRR